MLLKVRHARTELVFLSTHAASRAIFLPGELFPQVRPCLLEKGLRLLMCGHDAPKIQSSLERSIAALPPGFNITRRYLQQWVSNALGTAPDQDAHTRRGRAFNEDLRCSACGRCQTLEPIIRFGESGTDSQN